MDDQSYLDRKYFIDPEVYNCPFCNRNNVSYSIQESFQFHWSNEKVCYGYLVKCDSCYRTSMHLSYEQISDYKPTHKTSYLSFLESIEIDEKIFYSVPTSFFTIDSRVPVILRECITEAEGCLKMNYLTGASACMRKAIYELCVREKASGDNYEQKIKNLKTKYPQSDPALFDVLSHIKDMTSDKIHEQSWDKWESKYLKLIIETLKTVLYEIYVLPKERKVRSSRINQLREAVFKKKSNE